MMKILSANVEFSFKAFSSFCQESDMFIFDAVIELQCADFIRNWSLWCHSLCSCCIFTYFWAQNIFVFIFFHFQQGNLVVMSYLESLSESISLTCAGRAPFLHSICIIAEILTVSERLSDHFKNYFWMHFVHVRSFYYGNLNMWRHMKFILNFVSYIYFI